MAAVPGEGLSMSTKYGEKILKSFCKQFKIGEALAVFACAGGLGDFSLL